VRLYDYPASANCLKVRLLLALLERSYERVPVDIFAGDTQAPEFLALNPAGRTPVLELDDGRAIPESNAILVFLAEGTHFMPASAFERARVFGWLFLEQNLIESNVGTARFWRLTGRDASRPGAFAERVEAGTAGLAILERHLVDRAWLVGERLSAADVALYAYTHVAHEAGIDTEPFHAIAAWLRRIQGEPGFANDLESYPQNAMAGQNHASIHDRRP
jgi:glutathione S-transferase